MLIKMKAAVATIATAGLMATAGVGAAHAATITPGGTFSASAGASRFIVATGAGIPFNCTGSTGSATVTAGTYATPSIVGGVVPAFTSCLGPFGSSLVFACNATAPADLWLLGSPVAGVSPGELRGVDCLVTFTALSCTFRISGSIPTSYTNPSGTMAARITTLVAGQSLVTSASTCPASIFPSNATVAFGAPVGGGGSVANLTYILGGSGTGHPVVS